MLRALVPHCLDDEAIIDAFRCSLCQWQYHVENPQRGEVHEDDASCACQEFEIHNCFDYRRDAA